MSPSSTPTVAKLRIDTGLPIEQTVRAWFADFQDAKITDFVSVLVLRRATEQVRSMQDGWRGIA